MLDSLGMLQAAQESPERILSAHRRTAERAGQLRERVPFRAVHLLAEGSGSLVADAATLLAGPEIDVPVTIGGFSDLPGHVGRDTLVIALSGGMPAALTDGVLTAASGREATVVTIGGSERSGTASLHVPLPEPDMAPRAAVSSALVAVLGVLEQAGLHGSAFSEQAEHAAVALFRRRQDRQSDELVRLTRRIGRTLPLVYGSDPLAGIAARHWKVRINQDAKAPAFAHHVPALLHDELAGWAQHGDVTRQVFTMVLLRHDHETPEDRRALELVVDACQEVVASIETVQARGEGRLAQLLDLVMAGDLVALHMAEDAGIDPGPVPVTEEALRLRAGGSL